MSERPECRECPQASMRDYLAAKLADELDRLIFEAMTAPTPMAPAAADTLYRAGFYAGRVSGFEAALALVRVMFGVEASDAADRVREG